MNGMGRRAVDWRALARAYGVPCALAAVHFAVGWLVEPGWAVFEDAETSIARYAKHGMGSVFYYAVYYGTKAAYLCFLLVAWNFAAYIVRRFRAGDRLVRRGAFLFGAYFALMLALVLVLWPGTWAWDDIHVLVSVHHHGIAPWQHIITSAVQLVLLQAIPCPGGLIIMQNLCAAVCVAFAVAELEAHLLGGFRLRPAALDTAVKLLPFLLPPVLMYQLSGYRLGLYVYVELALVVMALTARRSGREWNAPRLALYGCLAVVVATWRTEGFVFMPVSCVLLLMQRGERCPVARKAAGCVLIALGFFVMDTAQKLCLRNSNYEVISTLTPCVELVRHAEPEDAPLVAELGRVIDLGMIAEHPEKSGTALYWLTPSIAREAYTKADYRAYLGAFFRLSLRHPGLVARERLGMFWRTTNTMGETAVTNVERTYKLYLREDESEGVREFVRLPANRPLFPRLRGAVILFLSCRAGIDEPPFAVYRLVWNVLPPILLLLAALAYCIARRRAYPALLLAAEAARVALSILTQPSPWVMYYLPEYLLGYVLLVYAVLGRASGLPPRAAL